MKTDYQKKREKWGLREGREGRWEVVRDSLVKDSTLGEWKLSFTLSGVALTFNRQLMVRTILIKAQV